MTNDIYGSLGSEREETFNSNPDAQQTSKPKRGRPMFDVTWPNTEFTAEEIYKSLENKLSRVSVHAKINSAVSDGTLITVGKIKPRTGRPKMVYKLASSRNA